MAARLAEGEGAKARLPMSAIKVGEVYYFLRKHQLELDWIGRE